MVDLLHPLAIPRYPGALPPELGHAARPPPPPLALRATFLLLALVGPMANLGRSQDPCADLVRAWVDPDHGSDPTYGLPLALPPVAETPLTAQINDPQNPYRTLQAAIDAVHAQLAFQFVSGATTQGVVYALPGVYGPASVGAGASGDTFPIRMRDRVSVRGLGTRRCTIRGASTITNPLPTATVFWPVASGAMTGGATSPAEILVDYGVSDVLGLSGFWSGLPQSGLPWSEQGDTAELLDGFTFEGGDVQVMISTPTLSPQPISGRITNCVFDMRHGWALIPGGPAISGPTFGVMLTKNMANGAVIGFSQQTFLIANNTFVMAEYLDGAGGAFSKSDSVGIIDVIDPCTPGFGLCYNNPGNPRELLGIGRSVIANNLFRTPMSSADQRRPMLGIDNADVLTKSAGGPHVPSNAFVAWATPTSYISNGGVFSGFHSRPVPTTLVSNGTQVLLVITQPALATLPAPTPAVTLWSGSTTATVPPEVDVSFVGEYLSSFLSPSSRDYRLMPYSDMKDKGVVSFDPPSETQGAIFESGDLLTFKDPPCSELASFQWDGGGYGNPRRIGPIDIGFDEIDAMIACGSWGDDSNSHNNPSAILRPGAMQGKPERIFIFDRAFQSQPCTIHGSGMIPQSNPPAWKRPPETLASPVINPALPPWHQTRYIRFTDAGPTPTGPAGTGWTFGAGAMLETFFGSPAGLVEAKSSSVHGLQRDA